MRVAAQPAEMPPAEETPALSGSVAELRRFLGKHGMDVSSATARCGMAFYIAWLAAALANTALDTHGLWGIHMSLGYNVTLPLTYIVVAMPILGSGKKRLRMEIDRALALTSEDFAAEQLQFNRGANGWTFLVSVFMFWPFVGPTWLERMATLPIWQQLVRVRNDRAKQAAPVRQCNALSSTNGHTHARRLISALPSTISSVASSLRSGHFCHSYTPTLH